MLRRDSVLDLLAALKNSNDLIYEATRRVVGTIVMTPYNNRTYRVDDIDWKQNPRSSFMVDGKPKTFVEYFQVGGPRVCEAGKVFTIWLGEENTGYICCKKASLIEVRRILLVESRSGWRGCVVLSARPAPSVE